MGNRDNFQWRPNDNSPTTNLRYQLEADHWLKAINSNQAMKGSGSMLGDIGNMFLVIGFLINVITLLVWGLWEVIKWIIRLFWTPKPKVRPMTNEEWLYTPTPPGVLNNVVCDPKDQIFNSWDDKERMRECLKNSNAWVKKK